MILAAAVLLVASACSDENGSPNRPAVAEPSSSPSAARAAVLPFVDEFDDDEHGWGGPFHHFDAGDYVWDVPSGQTDVRAPDTLIGVEGEIDDIVVTTSFTAVGMTGVGLQCAFEELEGSSRWYDLELGVEGVSIRKRPLGDAPVEILATNSSVTLTELPTEIVAECRRVNGEYVLSLSVDGVVAAEATDRQPFGRAGAPNLLVRAAPDGPGSEEHVVRFHRYAVAEHRPG